MKKITVRVADKELILSNPDKVYWPESQITKAELIDYYRQVAPFLLPHLRDRPLTMKRFPDGIDGKSFYQKDCPDYAPEWIATVPAVSEEKKTVRYILGHDLPTLVWMANLGCIEMHPWLSFFPAPDFPSALVFDLDPNEGSGFPQAGEIALLIRESLRQFGLNAYAKTSGARGLHIYVPLQPKYTFRQVQKAAKLLADTVVRLAPDSATTERTVKKRGPRVYIDCLQNARGQTIASVYSVRPYPMAPVSFPVSWEALERHAVNPTQYGLRNVPALLNSQGDLFAPVLTVRQSIDEILQVKLSPL